MSGGEFILDDVPDEDDMSVELLITDDGVESTSVEAQLIRRDFG